MRRFVHFVYVSECISIVEQVLRDWLARCTDLLSPFVNHSQRGQGRAARRARRPLEVKESVCQRMPFGFLGVTTLLSSPKVKRASRSLLRQVSKVSIPFDTVIKIQKINFQLQNTFLGASRVPFWGPFGTPFGLHLGASGVPWDTFGSLWGVFRSPWGPVWLHLGPSWLQWGSFRNLLNPFGGLQGT